MPDAHCLQPSPDALLKAILEWARADGRVLAVVQTGSRARGQRVDELSDLDIELVVRDVGALANDDSWFESFAPVLVALRLANNAPGELGWPTRLVVFRGGRKADFLIAGQPHITAQRHQLSPEWAHGYVVHLDKCGLLREVPTARRTPPALAPPTKCEFDDTVAEFWFEATQIPVYLARRELGPQSFARASCARRCCECSSGMPPQSTARTPVTLVPDYATGLTQS